MNAVERLWRGLADRDWDAIRAQLHTHATIELPHSGARLTAEEYAALNQAAGGAWTVHLHAVVASSEDLPVAVHATVVRDGVRYRCGGFYVLHQARIAHGVELWVPEGEALAAGPHHPAGHHRH